MANAETTAHRLNEAERALEAALMDTLDVKTAAAIARHMNTLRCPKDLDVEVAAIWFQEFIIDRIGHGEYERIVRDLGM
jgi:hypothetical protein